jgi:acyl-CoA synthetase (AMP-forming)/AMP-acid ligase II
LQTTSPAIANVGELASRAARIHAKRLAITSASRSVTYEELEQRSNRLANALCGLGLQRGDRVGVYLPNCVEIVELELACYKAALVKAPINARLAPLEVAEVVANSEAALIVTTAERAESFLSHLKAAPRLLLLDAV